MYTLERLPSAAGAYVLRIDTGRPVAWARPKARPVSLAPGRYLYCGSARGSGGIRSRVARHLRPEKALHWHVDRLTPLGRIAAVLAVPGGTECTLFERLQAFPGMEVPALGFGSSDCRTCPAHLLRGPSAMTDEEMSALLSAVAGKNAVLIREP